jgi:hypothetical protein
MSGDTREILAKQIALKQITMVYGVPKGCSKH